MMSIFASLMEGLVGIKQCNQIYSHIAHHEGGRDFTRSLLDHLNVRLAISEADRDQVPAKGPVVVVANHPFGGIEGILLADLLLSIRKDVKVMANYMLCKVPQLRELFIPVDPFNRSHSVRANVKPLRDAVRWVRDGGLLLVFPAGEVSHMTLSGREVADPPWHPMVATLIRNTRATVLPVYIHGRNRVLFHLAGLLHPRLRTVLLPREFLNQRDATVPINIGAPIAYRWLRVYADGRRLVDYLRWRTYLLGYRRHPDSERQGLPQISRIDPPIHLVAPRKVDSVKREIFELPATQLLERSGTHTVWQATADQIPETMIEIARLREVAFQAAGEGTGQPLDMDMFDHIYRHIFIWNEEREEIVGAYRLGPTDRILAQYGKKGLYTNTLFRSTTAFYDHLGPALEMGRSFIRLEYQKSYASLLLLWKGIGRFVARHPRYRILFGPVSISRDYSDLSRRLIATTLLHHSQAKDLAVMVRPRKPAPSGPLRVPGCRRMFPHPPVQDFKEVCALIGDIELPPREVPVLLRHYLNLGGQLLAFNIDHEFGDVMDGLIVVDLLKSDRQLLQRYMGADGVAALIEYHAAEDKAVSGSKNIV